MTGLERLHSLQQREQTYAVKSEEYVSLLIAVAPALLTVVEAAKEELADVTVDPLVGGCAEPIWTDPSWGNDEGTQVACGKCSTCKLFAALADLQHQLDQS